MNTIKTKTLATFPISPAFLFQRNPLSLSFLSPTLFSSRRQQESFRASPFVSRPPCLLPSPVAYAHASRSMRNPLSLRAHARNRRGTWFRSMHRRLSLRALARGGRVRCSKSMRQSNSGPYSDPVKEELIEVFLFLLSFLFYFLVPSYIRSLIVFLSTLQFAESLLSCWIHFFLNLSAHRGRISSSIKAMTMIGFTK
jgi:hypothetical protein